VASWRDQASAGAQRHLDELLGVTLGFARGQLLEHGEFFPYGAAVTSAAQVEMVAPELTQSDEHPTSADVLAACVETLIARRAGIQAAAVVADVATPEGDAIRVDLEHAEGIALTVLLPYSLSRSGGPPDYGQIRAQAGRAQVWNSG
jgi:hypothetical protein